MSDLSNITFKDVCDRLEAWQNVLILTHMRPDADTLGSAFALRSLLRGLGKRAEVINSDDSVPKRLSFIFGGESLREESLPADFVPEHIVSVDVSTKKLLDIFEETYGDRVDLAIDHHALGTPFAKETYVGDVGACGEIIVDIFAEFKSRGYGLLDKSAATALWAAISSDTGSFKFEAVTAETHMRIATLHKAGINHSEIARRLYDSRPISQIRATRAALNALHFYDNNRVAIINFTKAMMAENDVTKEDIDDIISITRGIEGVEVGVAIKESPDKENTYKVSMRSNRVADVAKLCAVFGGGGHKRAAGCTLTADNEKIAEEAVVGEIVRELAELDAANAFEGADEL